MDLRKIKKLIELFEDSALVEMEITEGENTIRLSRASTQTIVSAAPIASVEPSAASAPAPLAQEASRASDDAPSAGQVIASPLVGTFYDSSSPDDKPYVAVGSVVSKGDTLCLIEAMKTFNQLDAEIAGVVIKIHKNNGEPVEYGEPLFVIESR